MKNAEASGDVKTFARNLARCVADSEPESYDLSMLAAQYANASAPLPRCLRNKAVPLQDGTWVALEAPYYAYVESYPRPDPPSAGFEGNTNSEESEKADALIIAGLALIVLFGLHIMWWLLMNRIGMKIMFEGKAPNQAGDEEYEISKAREAVEKAEALAEHEHKVSISAYVALTEQHGGPSVHGA